MTDLNKLFMQHAVNKTAAAKFVGVSRATLAAVVAKDVYPAKWSTTQSERLATVLLTHGALPKVVAAALKIDLTIKKLTQKKNPQLTISTDQDFNSNKDSNKMLPRKSSLSAKTKQHFKLIGDPLGSEIDSSAQVYRHPDASFVFEAMLACAQRGGAIAVVGESGSGKTTLKQLLIEKLAVAESKVVLVEPYVQAMEDDDLKGKTLKSAAIAHSIIKALDPLARPKRDAQSRFEQLHTMLKHNGKAAGHCVLVIEEAHCLPIPTLKHLKRFLELRDGFKQLISVVLIGQPELAQRLNPKHVETREVSQRFDVVTLNPIKDVLVADYLRHKFAPCKMLTAAVIEPEAIDTLVARLAPVNQGGAGKRGAADANNLYPLAINNMLAAAMNDAALEITLNFAGAPAGRRTPVTAGM